MQPLREGERCPNCGGKVDEPAVRAQNEFGVYEERCEEEFHDAPGPRAAPSLHASTHQMQPLSPRPYREKEEG